MRSAGPSDRRTSRFFFEPWFNHIVHYGPIGAFGHPFSNYEPAYLYLLVIASLAHGLPPTMTIIKLLSVAGTVFQTVGFAALLKAAGATREEVGGGSKLERGRVSSAGHDA